MISAEKVRPNGAKGFDMEERLRNYFLSLGYFVLRGVKFTYNKFDVTDVDLWLYFRHSPLSRERTNVDIKNKRTPQALERIFWAKGVQNVLGLERCIVATTDSRLDVATFGLQHEVMVLDGHFLARLEQSPRVSAERLTEEQFESLLDKVSIGKLGGDWKGRYQTAKARVLTSLDFDGGNLWLRDIQDFLAAHLSGPSEGNATLRLVYACTGMLLVAVDFLMQGYVTLDVEQRRQHLTEGFRYGKSGRSTSEGIVRVASRLAAATTGQTSATEIVEREIRRQFSAVRSEVLGEFFAKMTAQGAIIDVAREFESAAYECKSLQPGMLSSSAQAVLGTLADYFGFDRKAVFGTVTGSVS